MQCDAIGKNGERCKSPAMREFKRCFFHSEDENHIKLRSAGRRAGGTKVQANNRLTLPKLTPDIHFRSLADVTEMLSQTANQLRKGKLEPRIAGQIGYLCSIACVSLNTAAGAAPTHVEFIVNAPSGRVPPSGILPKEKQIRRPIPERQLSPAPDEPQQLAEYQRPAPDEPQQTAEYHRRGYGIPTYGTSTTVR